LFCTFKPVARSIFYRNFFKEDVTLLTKDALTIKLGDITKIVSSKTAQQTKSFD
jgi:hypothetical protein